MVGLFSRISVYRRSHSSLVDIKETHVRKSDEVVETDCNVGASVGDHEVAVEVDFDFKPIDHPIEPADDDRPVKCPMPNSTVLNDGRASKGPFAEGLQKQAEYLVVNEEGIVMFAEPSPQAVRKRHHSLTQDHTPPFLPPQSTIFQLFQECKDFQS
eukprot:TRINITY_DN22329_c0_g1_i1.p1 TRINITY_DN22329_c0_g1~~TRINITY_DN22329_c0_g1_i1.p1  ORF type:complete len:156 (-),score=28.76 TRINITY_DN22329_c0_g1_i1:214-681(-)